MATSAFNTNSAILSSIPMRKDLKRYYLQKYRWVAEHNGLKQASDLFKEMREIALAYRADARRIERRNEYLQRMPVRKNGWLALLFDYLDSQPECVLNFLKLYCGMNQPLVSVEQSANTQDAYLASRDKVVNCDVPTVMKSWVMCFRNTSSTKNLVILYRNYRKFSDSEFHHYCKHHSLRDWLAYWSKWKRQLSIRHYSDDEYLQSAVDDEPLPEMYKDWKQASKSSCSLEADLYQLSAMSAYAESWDVEVNPTVTPAALNFTLSFLNPSLWGYFQRMEDGEVPLNCKRSFLDGQYVGHIHHIPKKGTVKRRPIAAPNRFLQMGMAPISLVLYGLIRQLERDCTFNQSKLDKKIQNRVNNSNLYVGSVDLSQATDNLPFAWGEYLYDNLVAPFVPEIAQNSWSLFQECARSRWNNDGILSSWTVGQPLGCGPSFAVLALTHNILLECLSLRNGLGHSPYAILGDDLVVFNKKLRKTYIRFLSNRGIPLSLHKSYEGNLTEFAGRVFVKNGIPFGCSDQTAITFSNLFDWQRASCIPIPYDHLPSKVRAKFERSVKAEGVSEGVSPVIYELLQQAVCTSRYLPFREEEGDLISKLFELLPLDKATKRKRKLPIEAPPESPMLSGIVRLGGHPVTYLNYGYAEKHGNKQRYQVAILPEWYELKFRPFSTTQLIHCGCKAVKEVKGT